MRATLGLATMLIGGCASPAPGVASAAQKYPDVHALFAGTVTRTCSPNNGVCHNNRQFPDLQTASGLLQTVNARCNQLRDDPLTIDNLCEPLGDLFRVGAFASRIGNVSATPPTGTPNTITLTLHDPLPPSTSGEVALVREVPGLSAVTLPIPDSARAILDPGTQAVTLWWAPLDDAAAAAAPGGTLATFLVPTRRVAGEATQVQLGDPNGDGIFGADLGGALVKPGRPLDSYLFLRVRGAIEVGPDQRSTNTAVAQGTEPQMPLANRTYWDDPDAITALGCWIAGLSGDASPEAQIDYGRCDPDVASPSRPSTVTLAPAP
jgi:hypothetical protein